ncbi:MAG TPA: hypothetical protein VEC36_05045 [Patescibacteria group bacterium]|nr:hypothetical protein [Patescibacteria group bacterium]
MYSFTFKKFSPVITISSPTFALSGETEIIFKGLNSSGETTSSHEEQESHRKTLHISGKTFKKGEIFIISSEALCLKAEKILRKIQFFFFKTS